MLEFLLFTELKKLASLLRYDRSKLGCTRVFREMYGKSHSWENDPKISFKTLRLFTISSNSSHFLHVTSLLEYEEGPCFGFLIFFIFGSNLGHFWPNFCEILKIPNFWPKSDPNLTQKWKISKIQKTGPLRIPIG